jgi:PAS domain S-box-containing protein
MFGYKKGDVEGKNVNILMPNPFSSRHNNYLRNYLTTGKAKILDQIREVRTWCLGKGSCA